MKTTIYDNVLAKVTTVVLDLQGARPDMFALARIAVLLETYGQVSIVNAGKSDNPGEQLLHMGFHLGQGHSDEALISAAAGNPQSTNAKPDSPNDHFAEVRHRIGEFCGDYNCNDCLRYWRVPHMKP